MIYLCIFIYKEIFGVTLSEINKIFIEMPFVIFFSLCAKLQEGTYIDMKTLTGTNTHRPNAKNMTFGFKGHNNV